MADDKVPERQNTVGRRELLKVLSTVPAAALLPGVAAKAAEKAKPDATATPAVYQPKTLSTHEYRTVEVLSDIILPADERSGSATQAGVPEFIDDWLGYAHGLPTIRGGIVWLDLESNRAFGHDFVEASASEQKQLLDRIAYPKTAAPEDAAGVVFFNEMRSLVLNGFYSSKMGVEDFPYLGNQIVAEWKGCPPNVLAKLGVSYEKD